MRLEPGDEVHIECAFDNRRANQPIVAGERPEPRDVAWGSDNQDMCAGFLAFASVEGS